MAVATINTITTTQANTEVLSANNLAFTLGSFSVGSCVIVMAATRHATLSYATLSGAGVYWNLVATYALSAPSAEHRHLRWPSQNGGRRDGHRDRVVIAGWGQRVVWVASSHHHRPDRRHLVGR